MPRWRFKKTERDMFGSAIGASATSPSQAPPSPGGAGANRTLDHGDNRSDLDHPSGRWRNPTNLGLAGTLDAFRRGNARAVLDAQRAEMRQLSERAAQLEQAAERFKQAGDEKTAASFAQEAAQLRRAGA
jgi:hypothetical protein